LNFLSAEAAQDALTALAKRWKYHQVASSHLTAHKRYAGKGRPTASTPFKAIEWQIQAQVRADDEALERDKQAKACYVLGTHIAAREVSDTEVITAYKGQAHVEGSFRFLKPRCFSSRRCLSKNPTGLQGYSW
jgi:transposase